MNAGFIPAFSFGFGAWWVTGFDDLVLLMGLLHHYHRRPEMAKVVMGQFAAIQGVYWASFLLSSWVANVVQGRANLISGCLLIIIGIFLLVRQEEPEESLQARSPFLSGFLVYLLNSSDDFTVLSASFLGLGMTGRIVLGLGFVCGWILMVFLAEHGKKTMGHWAKRFAPLILIAGGLYQLIRGWMSG